jgi:hypothetical protein
LPPEWKLSSIIHRLRFGRGRRRLSLPFSDSSEHLVDEGPRPAGLDPGLLRPELFLPDECLVELDGLNNDGQGQGEEGNCRHHRPQAYAGLSHGSVLNWSVWLG